MVGQHAFNIYRKIKNMVICNKQQTYFQLSQKPYCQIAGFSTLPFSTKNKLILLENNYTTDELIQYFSSILFVNPWTKLEDVSPFQTDMKDLNFLFHNEIIDFYKYFKVSTLSILFDNINKPFKEIFTHENIKKFYPSILTINQLYILNKLFPNMIQKNTIYFNLVNNWLTVCQFELDQYIGGSQEIILNAKKSIEEKLNVLY